MCFTMFSEALRTPQTDGQTDRDTIKGFRAQPPGKPVRMRINLEYKPGTRNPEYKTRNITLEYKPGT